MSRKEIRSSLLIGGSAYLILLAVQLIRASTGDSIFDSVIRGILIPGLFLSWTILGNPQSPTGLLVLGFIFLVGSAVDIALYAGAALLVRRGIASLRRPSGRAAAVAPEMETPERVSLRRSAETALLIGAAVAVGFYAVSLLIRSHWLGFLTAPGFFIYRTLFGLPSHGAGGIWLVTTTAINWLIYSTVVFIVEVAIAAYRRRAALH